MIRPKGLGRGLDALLAGTDDEALAELSTGGTVLGFGVSQSPGSVRDVLDFFDRTGLAPEPLLLTPPCGMVADYRPWRRLADDLTERLS